MSRPLTFVLVYIEAYDYEGENATPIDVVTPWHPAEWRRPDIIRARAHEALHREALKRLRLGGPVVEGTTRSVQLWRVSSGEPSFIERTVYEHPLTIHPLPPGRAPWRGFPRAWYHSESMPLYAVRDVFEPRHIAECTSLEDAKARVDQMEENGTWPEGFEALCDGHYYTDRWELLP